MTAHQLANLLASAGVRFDFDDGEIVVTGRIPAELEGVTWILKTGLAAIATGRCWYAFPASGHVVILDPAKSIPARLGWARLVRQRRRRTRPQPGPAYMVCLAVGDVRGGWDRIRDWWRLDYPHLFTPPKKRERGQRASKPVGQSGVNQWD